MATSYFLRPSSSTVAESAGRLTVTISRSGSNLPSETLYLSTTTNQGFTNNNDYSGLLNQRVSFSAGQTSRTVTIDLTDDSVVEPNETFGLVLQRSSSDRASTYVARTTFTIGNDDVAPPPPPTYAITPAAATVLESAGRLTVTISRSGSNLPSETLYLSTTTNQGFTNNNDYSGLLNQRVSFSAGQTSRTVTIDLTDDSVVEPNETFGLVLQHSSSDPASTYVARTTFTIGNDDAAPPPPPTGPQEGLDFRQAGSITATAIANDPTNNYKFVLNYLGPRSQGYLTSEIAQGYAAQGLAPVSVSVYESIEGVDEGQLFNPNLNRAAYVANVMEHEDGVVHATRAYNQAVAIGQPAGSAIYFAVDADVLTSELPKVIDYFTGIRDGFSALSGGAPIYQVGAYGAGAVLDAVHDAGLAQWKWLAAPTGWNGSAGYTAYHLRQTVTDVIDPDLSASVRIDRNISAGSSYGQWGSGPVATGSGTLAIGRLNAQKAEGAAGSTTAFTFTVRRSGDTTLGATADWAVTGGGGAGTIPATPADFADGAFPRGVVSFATGQATQTVTVTVAGDRAPELNEGFTVTLARPQAGVSIGTSAAVGAILNDDVATPAAATRTPGGTVRDDVFLLGAGSREVTGGGGMDRFLDQPSVIGAAPANATTMEDLSRALGETLDLSAIAAIAATLSNDAFTLIGTAAFNGTPGELLWEDLGTCRLIQGNVNTDTTADITIFARAAGPVDSSWFVF